MACVYVEEMGGWTDTNDYYPCDPNAVTGGGNIHTPQVTVTGGGYQMNSTNLDKISNSILAALAILKGAKKIPTTLDDSNDGFNPATFALLQQAQNSGGRSGNTAGNFQQFIEQNKGAVIIAGLIGVAFFLKPPIRGR